MIDLTPENLMALAEHFRKSVVVTRFTFNTADWNAVKSLCAIDNTTVGSPYRGVRVVIDDTVPTRKVKCDWSDDTSTMLPI